MGGLAIIDPPLLAPGSTDEYRPVAPSVAVRRAASRVDDVAAGTAHRLSMTEATYLSGRLGTAATLRALDAEHGGGFFAVAGRRRRPTRRRPTSASVPSVRWSTCRPTSCVRAGPRRRARRRCSASSAWSSPSGGPIRSTRRCSRRRRGPTACSAAARRRSPSSPRHPASRATASSTTPTSPPPARSSTATPAPDGCSPTRSSTRTSGRPSSNGWASGRPRSARRAGRCTRCGTRPARPTGGWFLDDDVGDAFLRRVDELGPRIVCAHKGLAGPIPSLAPAAASPRDIGPAAAAFRDIEFVVYHSGYDIDARSRGRRPRRRPAARREPAGVEPRRRRRGAGRQRVGRARLDLVPHAAPAGGGGPRPRQAARRGRRGPDPVGHRLRLVRTAPTAHRRVPGLHDPRVDATRVRLPGAHARGQAEDPRRQRVEPVRHRPAAPTGRRAGLDRARPAPSWRPGFRRAGQALRRSSSRRAVPPRNSAIASSSSGRPCASSSDRCIGNHGSSLPHSTRPRYARRLHERHEGRVEVARRVRGARQVQRVPLAHVVHEQLFVRVAHVRADHGERREVDQHVLEQLGMLHPRAHPRPRHADVDGDRKPELLAQLVDRVVLGVVDRHLGEQRRHPHQSEARVLRPGRGGGATLRVGLPGSTIIAATRNRPGCASATSSACSTPVRVRPGVRTPVATPRASIRSSSASTPRPPSPDPPR